MSQSSHAVPVVTANVAGSRRQVNLRDYLNQRVAPFLKKAIHESLDAETEYPLQWLGEHLIQQSILYEGNPDQTNIRERFIYKHDQPPKQTPQTGAVDSARVPVLVPATSSTSSSLPAAGQSVTNEMAVNGPDSTNHTPVSGTTNGTADELANGESATHDTEMGGTT